MKLEWVKKKRFLGDAGVARSGHTATLVGNRVYVLGGYSESNPGDFPPQNCVFQTRKKKWQVLNPQALGRFARHTATLVKDRILIIGGDTGESFQPIHMRWFDPVTLTESWAIGNGVVPGKRLNHVAGYFEARGQVIVFGGKVENRDLNDPYKLQIDRMEWAPLICRGVSPQPQSNNTACVVHNVMYIHCHVERKLFLLDYSLGFAAWSTVSRMSSSSLYGGSLNYHRGKLISIAFGGGRDRFQQADVRVCDLRTQISTTLEPGRTKNSMLLKRASKLPCMHAMSEFASIQRYACSGVVAEEWT